MSHALDHNDLVSALDLPAASRVDKRVAKTLLVENGAPTAADKRRINEGIEELHWLAALKPTTIGISEYRDSTRDYLEIAVLSLVLRPKANLSRLVELVHRAVPYPVLLLTRSGTDLGLSAAHKRWAQNEAGKMVLDGEVVSVALAGVDTVQLSAFRYSLALGRQPRLSLYALYQGWIDTLHALNAARLTGVFTLAASAERAASRSEALRECTAFDAEIARLRAAAAREKQVSRRVKLNLELKRVVARRAAASAKL